MKHVLETARVIVDPDVSQHAIQDVLLVVHCIVIKIVHRHVDQIVPVDAQLTAKMDVRFSVLHNA